MIDNKIILGVILTIIQLASYVIYLYGVYKGKTKPHAFTWLVWAVINVIAFGAVISAGGGPGAWSLGVNVLACFTLAVIGYIQKNVVYDLLDWFALGIGILGAILWGVTKNPLSAVLLVAVSDAIAVVPTVRKAFRLPFDENATSFTIGLIVYTLSLFALKNFNLTTALYPIEIMLTDIVVVATVLIRRRQINLLKSKETN